MQDSVRRRNTRQKSLVSECLQKFPDRHMTAEDIVFELRNSGTPVGKATVYRALSRMEAEGSAMRYDTGPDGAACYSFIAEESGCASHYHAVCSVCGLVLHLESEQLDIMARRLSEENGFRVDGSRTVVYGRCRGCAANLTEK